MQGKRPPITASRQRRRRSHGAPSCWPSSFRGQGAKASLGISPKSSLVGVDAAHHVHQGRGTSRGGACRLEPTHSHTLIAAFWQRGSREPSSASDKSEKKDSNAERELIGSCGMSKKNLDFGSSSNSIPTICRPWSNEIIGVVLGPTCRYLSRIHLSRFGKSK